MAKKGSKQPGPQREPGVRPEQASALAILLQRQNLLEVYHHLPKVREQMGGAEYAAWVAREFPGLGDPLALSANEFLRAICSTAAPELAELLTDPAALAELERLAYGQD